MCYMWVAYAAMVAATAASATASYEQGQSQSAIAKYNARMTAQSNQAQETVVRRKAQSDIASQTVQLGSQGTRVDTGSPLLLLGESARNAELNALSVRKTGQMQVAGYKYQASAASTNGYLGAGAELLSGASSIYQLAAANGDLKK